MDRNQPFRDELRQNNAQTLCEVASAKIILIGRLQRRPRRSHGEEFVLLGPSLRPRNTLGQGFRVGLLNAIPAILQCLILVPDESKPAFFFTWLDAIGFGEDTWGRGEYYLIW
jgi:hypothetical protein